MISRGEYIKRIADHKTRIVKACKKCGGVGHVPLPMSEGEDEAALTPHVERCSCWHEWMFKVNLIKSGLPEEFHAVEAIVPEYNRQMFIEVRRYTGRIDRARKHGLGFVMLGDNGAGKTTAGAKIICKAIRAGFSAYYTTFQQLMIDIQAGFDNHDVRDDIDNAMMRDFLVLDELGKEYRKSDSSWVLSRLDSLLRRRRGEILPTIMISNCTFGEIEQVYGDSVASLIRSRMRVLNFEPGDFRKRQGDMWENLMGGDDE